MIIPCILISCSLYVLILNVPTVRVRASLSESVEPQPLHRPALRHPLRPSTLCLLLQLAAGGPPHGTDHDLRLA